MATNKITLNELKSLVKKIIKESSDNNNIYDKYSENIYNRQSEYSAKEQLYSFASENGFDSSEVDDAMKTYKHDTEDNIWGEKNYTKEAIKKMVYMIAGL